MFSTTATSLWAILKPANAGEFWTFALTLATSGLVIVAYFGLKSIALSKQDMLNRAKRESVQCAIDQTAEMGRELLPLYAKLVTDLSQKNIPLFVSDASHVSFGEKEEIQKINSAIAWMGLLDREVLPRMIDFMNHLEYWSMCFTHDPALADEKVAFDPCSAVFCQMVMTLYPAFLTPRRQNPASGPFQKVVTLFKGWYTKTAQGQLLEQIKRLQSDGAKLPPPLGTSLD